MKNESTSQKINSQNIESQKFEDSLSSYNSNLKYRIQNSDEIYADGARFLKTDVIHSLQGHLTHARVERITKVLADRTFSISVVCEHLYDIGNISAVMRSAESFGFLPFHIVERPEAKYKMSDRISRGSEKWLDISKHKSTEECFKNLKSQGYQIFSTDLSATHKLEDIDFTKKTAIVLGNEKEGISKEAKKHSDGTFIIPMYGFAQSFNISVAAALCFYHIHQFRKSKLGKSGDLTSDEVERVRAYYYLRTLDSGIDILNRLKEGTYEKK